MEIIKEITRASFLKRCQAVQASGYFKQMYIEVSSTIRVSLFTTYGLPSASIHVWSDDSYDVQKNFFELLNEAEAAIEAENENEELFLTI